MTQVQAMIQTIKNPIRSALVCLLLTGPVQALAAPITVDLTGTITAATGNAVPFLNTSVNAHAVFDLDENNALFEETLTPAGEPTFTRWTFSGTGVHSVAPYNQTTFSGDFGLFSNPSFLDVETIDNLDADALGNPFGVTGTVDVLSIFATTDVVACPVGQINPATGACLVDAAVVESEFHSINYVGASDWFSGTGVLPSSLLASNELIGIFGNFESQDNTGITATADVVYQALNTTSVPTPAPIALLLGGLAVMLKRNIRRTV